MKSINILWFKKDLRVYDNQALFEATQSFDILPIYIIEKDLWRQSAYSKRQWDFFKECLIDLRIETELLGQPLIIRTGNVVDIFEQIKKNFNIKGIYCHQETGDLFTYKRDEKVRKWASKRNIPIKEYLQFGVFRGSINRDNWSKQWKKHINKKIFEKPKKINYINYDIGQIPNDKEFLFKKDKCAGRLIGGRKKAIERLDLFFNENINFYSENISCPEKAFDSCSRMSPYITWGCVSLRELFIKTDLKINKNTRMLKNRLFWHCHFIQKLENQPDLERKEFHPYFSGIRIKNNYLLNLWSEGRTGFPFLDACMRSLNHNGWINFRMRAMLMSFASYNLWLPWQDSGLVLAQKFVDYEPGIHWSQCQMQSGTTSINTNRIYNPIKQGKDHDPLGHFIRKWIPELKDISSSFIHEPWLSGSHKDEKSNAIVNYYDKPIVDIITSTKEARQKMKKISLTKGYYEISKDLYRRHGSRKRNFNKRTFKTNANKVKESLNTHQLNLDL